MSDRMRYVVTHIDRQEMRKTERQNNDPVSQSREDGCIQLRRSRCTNVLPRTRASTPPSVILLLLPAATARSNLQPCATLPKCEIVTKSRTGGVNLLAQSFICDVACTLYVEGLQLCEGCRNAFHAFITQATAAHQI